MMKLIISVETTETVPENDVQTNSILTNNNPQNKNGNSSATENNIDITESTTQSNESSQSTCTIGDATNEPQSCEDSIRIRLKYLNDDCRLVDGKLYENIGVFKRYFFKLLIIRIK